MRGNLPTHVMGMDKDGKNTEVAMRENDIIIYEDDYTTKYEGVQSGDPASYIMFSLMQYAYKDQSMMFAEIIQKHFKADLPMPDRGRPRAFPRALAYLHAQRADRGGFPFQSDRPQLCHFPARGRARRRGRVQRFQRIVRARWRAGPMSSCCARPRRSPSGERERQDSAPSGWGGTGHRLVGQEPYDGVLYYVQIGFLGSRKPLNDRVFKSYRNRVTEKENPDADTVTSWAGCGIAMPREDTVRGPEGVPDAFVVAMRAINGWI